METNNTIAGAISDRFNDDGTVFKISEIRFEDGQIVSDEDFEIIAVCEAEASEKYEKNGELLFVFTDKSMIFIGENWWDVLQCTDIGTLADSSGAPHAELDEGGDLQGWDWRIPGLKSA